jgi:hypothetical protein
VISLPAGTRIWPAAGVTNKRCGFQGFWAKVQTALEENPLAAMFSCLEAAAAARSRSFGQPRTGSVCSPGGSNMAVLTGRRPTAAKSI